MNTLSWTLLLMWHSCSSPSAAEPSWTKCTIFFALHFALAKWSISASSYSHPLRYAIAANSRVTRCWSVHLPFAATPLSVNLATWSWCPLGCRPLDSLLVKRVSTSVSSKVLIKKTLTQEAKKITYKELEGGFENEDRKRYSTIDELSSTTHAVAIKRAINSFTLAAQQKSTAVLVNCFAKTFSIAEASH